MTYLSRIRINPLRAKSRSLLVNPRIMHSYVCAGIPGSPTDERLLWRVDNDNRHRPILYVLTGSKPDWTHLVEEAGWPASDGDHAAVADYAPLLARLTLGRQFAFRLTASPVQNTNRPDKLTEEQKKRLERGDQRRGFRLGHRTAKAQLGWLIERVGKHGFEIPPAHTEPAVPDPAPLQDATPAADVRLIRRDRVSVTKGRGGPTITMHTATFEGRLTVTDVDLLTHALLNGIGPSKAYGCGLLTLAPLKGR